MPTQNDVHPPKQDSSPEVPTSHEKGLKSKSNLRKWVIIATLTFVILVSAIITVFFLQNNKTATNQNTRPTLPTEITNANWKTYTNAKYNYSINYPNNWTIREFPDSNDGAAFNPADKPGYPDKSDSISISVGQKIGNYINYTLEEYAKVAGAEIQNYNNLASIKKLTTEDGVVGYETTWMVQPMSIMGRPPEGTESESLPITYFELPGNKASLVRISLDRDEDLDMYEKMITTIKFTTPLTPIPTSDEAALLKIVIKKYIALKHNSNENSLNITVSKIEGTFAQGGVSDEGGGAMWFAAKEDGVWKLVWDGNGVIECSTFSLYPNFSKSMIPECWDETTQNTVQR